MPTLFRRHYMRKRVPKTERVIGVCVLALTAVIFVTVAAVSLSPSKPLFQVAPENEAGPTGRQLVVARSMLPPLGTAGWSAGDVEVIEWDQISDDDLRSANARDFDVRHVYRGRYVRTGTPDQRIEVLICDAGRARNAFGLYKTTVPDSAAVLNMGCEGWQVEDRAAFWAGRYCTQFAMENVQGGEPSVKTVADALAGVQLRYGAPFWAESVLPAVGRRAGSFRFVHKQAGAFEFLNDAFLAEYEDSVTCFVTDSGSSAKADGLAQRFRQYLEERGRVQAAPTDDSPLLAGDIAGRQIAVFAFGNRVFGAVGTDMELVSRLAKTMLATAQPAIAFSAAAPPVAVEESVLPEIGLAGWGAARGVRVYTPVDLWEKINGRADVYLMFEMVKMTFGTYRKAGDAEAFVDVYLYDMGEPDNAFGIYRAEMGSRPASIALGRDGYVAPGGVFFWKGQHYVRVETADTGEELAEAAEAVGRAVAAGIKDDDRPLWAEALLPATDRVEGSFEYFARDAFSLDFLQDTFCADYRVGEKEFKTFIHRAASEAEARGVFDAYGKFFAEYGSVLKRDSRDGSELMVGDSGGVIDAVFVVGDFIGGVTGCVDTALAEERATAFAESLAEAARETR